MSFYIARKSGKVIQSHGMPNFIDESGIASLRVIISIDRSRDWVSPHKTNPQLPITTEVTPCQHDMLQ